VTKDPRLGKQLDAADRKLKTMLAEDFTHPGRT
jgi:hypothetical protein